MHPEQPAIPAPDAPEGVPGIFLLEDADIFGDSSEEIPLLPHDPQKGLWRVATTPFFAPLSYRDLVTVRGKNRVIEQVRAVSLLPRITLLAKENAFHSLAGIIKLCIDLQRHPENANLVSLSFNSMQGMQQVLSQLPNSVFETVNQFHPEQHV